MNLPALICCASIFCSSSRACFHRNYCSRAHEYRYQRSRADTLGLFRPRDTRSSVPVRLPAVGPPARAGGAESGREKEAELRVRDGACARALTQYSVTLTRSRDPLRAEVEIHPPTTHPWRWAGSNHEPLSIQRVCFNLAFVSHLKGTFDRGRARHSKGDGAPCWRTGRRAGICRSA